MSYVYVSCFAVRGCAVSRRYINVCNCDMFSDVYLDHLKFCVVCINELTPYIVQPIGMHSGEVIYCGCFCFRGGLVS